MIKYVALFTKHSGFHRTVNKKLILHIICNNWCARRQGLKEKIMEVLNLSDIGYQ